MPRGVASLDAETSQRLFRARDERDVVYLVEWLRRYPEQGDLPARWLAEWGETAAVDPLIRMLRSFRPEARRTAARRLGDLGPVAEARDALEETATADDDAAARSWAYSALGKYRDPALLQLLLSALDEQDWRVRNGAAVGLAELGDRRALGPLRQRLRRLRYHPVAWYLNRSAYKQAIHALTAADS